MLFNHKNMKRRNSVRVLGDKGVVLTERYQIPYCGTNNMNTIVISSVGTGKTRGFLKSNLLQKGCSFVVTDTKGDLFNEFAGYLKSNAGGSDSYEIKLVNLKNPQWSNNYNPFRYMHTEEDVVGFATALSVNICKNEEDSFWLNMSINLIASMCFFVFETYPEKERNIKSLIDIFNKYIKQHDPMKRGVAESYYKDMMMAMPDDSKAKSLFLKCDCIDRTWSSAVATVGQAIAVFEYGKLLNLVSDDNLELENIGYRKTAVFINLDDTNPCYDFIAGLLYTQIFQVLYKQADERANCQLAEHVRFFMDDFANYKIPNISHILSTCRSRGISIEMILQSESQLQSLYGCEADNLIANSTYIYIGGNDLTTQTNIAQRLGCSVQEIQQSVNQTFIFFPEGKTLRDTKADYLKHCLYELLKKQPKIEECFIGDGKMMCFDLWSCEHEEKYKDFRWVRGIADFQEEYALGQIDVRDNDYDSDEERLFYETLTKNEDFQKLNINIFVHQDIREVFNLNKVPNNSLRYKLMLMHCDFVFKGSNGIIAGVEIDGMQHVLDPAQTKNDVIKDKLFKNNNIPLYRIKAIDIRTDCEKVCNGIIYKMKKDTIDTTEENDDSENSVVEPDLSFLIPNYDKFFF